MPRLFWNIFKESASLHLLLPLIVSFFIGTGVAWFHGPRSLQGVADHWLGGAIWELLAIYVTFLFVLVIAVRHQTQVRMANIGALRDVLPGSVEYFAIGAIPIQEWFDPAVQVYLATIVGHQNSNSGYKHQRVLIFFDESSLEDVHVNFVDEYYARCLQAVHDEFDIPLAYIKQADLFQILDGMSPSDRSELGWYPQRAWSVSRVLKRVSKRWFTKDRQMLAFAVVTDTNGKQSVVRFTKGKRVLDLSALQDHRAVKPYLELTKRVKAHIYVPGTTQIARRFEFGEHIRL